MNPNDYFNQQQGLVNYSGGLMNNIMGLVPNQGWPYPQILSNTG